MIDRMQLTHTFEVGARIQLRLYYRKPGVDGFYCSFNSRLICSNVRMRSRRVATIRLCESCCRYCLFSPTVAGETVRRLIILFLSNFVP